MLLRVVKKLSELTDDPDMIQFIDVEKGMELGRKEDIEEAAQKAAKEAEKKTKIETAKKLLKNNVDINIIVDSTSLSKEDIEKLQN